MFTSPEIPFVQSSSKGIEAAQVWVADSLALGKTTTIFPGRSVCLPIPAIPGVPAGAKKLLEVLPGKGYKFEVPKLALAEMERTLKIDAGLQTVAQTNQDGQKLFDSAKQIGENVYERSKQLSTDVVAAKSSISLAIDTASNLSKVDITNIHVVTKTVNKLTKEVKDATRAIGTLSSDAQKVASMLGADLSIDTPGVPKVPDSVKHVFGSALEEVQKVLSFLEHLKFLPHFKVSMTNEWAMIMSTSMNREDLLRKVPPPTNTVVGKVIERFEFLISATLCLASFLLKLHNGTTIKIPTGVGPIVALGTGAFDIAMGTTGGVQVKLELSFGIGVDFSVGPFSASASFNQSQTILYTKNVFGLGITAVLRAHVDLVVASADLYLEAKLLVVGERCDQHTHSGHDDQESIIWRTPQCALPFT